MPCDIRDILNWADGISRISPWCRNRHDVNIPMCKCQSLKEIDRESCCENTTPLPTLPLFTSAL
jgi:hypothetical protein